MKQYDQIGGYDHDDRVEYFQLMGIAGTHGRYQCISLIIWCVIWLVTGSILLGTPFYMLNQPYICPNLSSEQECRTQVCAMSPQSRQAYLPQNGLTTIANSFQDLHCQRAWIPDMLISLVYLGSFFGYISISIMVDNIGRKKAMIISFGVAVFGMVITALAANLYMVGAGLLLMGYGSDSAINICFYFITETMEERHRERYSIFIQIFFCLGGVVNIGYFYLLKNWRLVFWAFLIAPSLLCLIAIIFIVRETPYFLIKLKQQQQIMQDLNYIYKLNHSGSQMPNKSQLTLSILINQLKAHQQSIQKATNNQTQGQSSLQPSASRPKKLYTPLDLFRYSSIRFISIAICLLSFFIYILYYGPIMLISKLSFNIYVNALVVTISELLTYPISIGFIHCIPRRLAGIVLYAICAVSSLGLVFNIAYLCDPGDNTQSCKIVNILQMVLIFIFRFSCSLQFAIFLLYTNQELPTQVRGIGLGVSSALGTIASTSSPYIFGSALNSNSATSKIMIVFVVLSVIGVGLWCRLPQTLGAQIRDQIKEVQEEAQMLRQMDQNNQIKFN